MTVEVEVDKVLDRFGRTICGHFARSNEHKTTPVSSAIDRPPILMFACAQEVRHVTHHARTKVRHVTHLSASRVWQSADFCHAVVDDRSAFKLPSIVRSTTGRIVYALSKRESRHGGALKSFEECIDRQMKSAHRLHMAYGLP